MMGYDVKDVRREHFSYLLLIKYLLFNTVYKGGKKF